MIEAFVGYLAETTIISNNEHQATTLTIITMTFVNMIRTISISIAHQTSIDAIRIRETIETARSKHARLQFQRSDNHRELRQRKLLSALIDNIQFLRVKKVFTAIHCVTINVDLNDEDRRLARHGRTIASFTVSPDSDWIVTFSVPHEGGFCK